MPPAIPATTRESAGVTAKWVTLVVVAATMGSALATAEGVDARTQIHPVFAGSRGGANVTND